MPPTSPQASGSSLFLYHCITIQALKMVLEADDTFFPSPTRQVSSENSFSFPDVTPASTAAIQRILKDNHLRHHVFFNDKGFHNHIVHTTLTLWCLGADERVLQRSYEEHSKKQRPAFASPHAITKENWIEHLGDENFYQAYVEFFKSELEQRQFKCEELLEEYIFSASANFIPGAKKQPEMLSRFFDNLFHPMIHVGFGLEFSVPGVFVEGLAQAAMHPPTATRMIPQELFEQDVSPSSNTGTDPSSTANVHALSILARVLADPAFELTSPPENIPSYFSHVVNDHGDAIRKHAAAWTLEGDLRKKVEELIWAATVIYGVGGLEESGELNADFFLMHLVTSSVFLFNVLSRLTQRKSQELFLRGYLSVSLAYYIARGRPHLDIQSFFGHHTETFHTAAMIPQLQLPEPWSRILRSAIMHMDDHVPKLQRALADHASRFGGVPRGTFTDTQLDGAEWLDGTLFLRVAGLTTLRLGGDVKETRGFSGDEVFTGEWDRRAFFK
ncbi:hypothetical protein CPC08DRAFT_765575 [Agrocybe pediades]|nr:hypothetical protein CPC08DRAFT_765575 [Agrocybe pediades]